MRRACLTFLAFLLLASACAGERPTLDESAAREVDPLDVGEELDTSEHVAVRLAVPEGLSLDPADAGAASLASRVVADLLYEGLTALDQAGSPVPALAERWFVSDDRLTWTFVLPEDSTFGDGGALTARDAKTSLERVAARGGADQAATALTVIAGWTDHMAGEAGGVAGISAVDATTLVIRLNLPNELLLNVLASPAFGVTALDDAGSLRTTGAFRATEVKRRYEAVDADAEVAQLTLVTHPNGPAAALASGDADWAVLATGEGAAGLEADVVRQPLDLEIALVARSPIEDERLGLLGALEPLLLASAVDGLTARASSRPADPPTPPSLALVDIPSGVLDALGVEIVGQLEAAGVDVLLASLDPVDFAARVASGDAVLFPIVSAGGTGPASALIRSAVPGGSDDVFGPDSDARAELAQAVVTELDLEQRDLFADALEQALIDAGLLLPIGQFEVRVALGHRLDGLRHRSDGTLDLSDVHVADEGG